jgi:uncharacterized membrane protein
MVHPYILSMTEALIRACAVSGAIISLYFVVIAYRVIRPDIRWMPAFCRLDEQTCMKVLYTPLARVLGIPNSFLGLVYYLSIIFLPLPAFQIALLTASIFSVGLGMYLMHALLIKLRISCPLCFTAHIINLVIANLLIVYSLKGE